LPLSASRAKYRALARSCGQFPVKAKPRSSAHFAVLQNSSTRQQETLAAFPGAMVNGNGVEPKENTVKTTFDACPARVSPIIINYDR